MTELYINGEKVELPEGFSITLTEENPFFTKRGQYTLDLELSMASPINVIIFKHCNRLNNVAPIDENLRAILVIDNRVWLNGTVIILEPSDSSIKIQLVSGNSELNYLGSDSSVRSLDLGSATLETITNQKLSLNHHYPDRDFQILPFMTNDNDFIGNSYYYVDFAAGVGNPILNDILYYWGCFKPNTGMAENWSFNPLYNRRPQPYLCFIIKKVVEALGYTLNSNAIALDSIFKNAYVVHGYDTLSFAKMLPDWTVTEFFQEIEEFFDVTIMVNNQKKLVDIMFNYSYLSQTNKKQLTVIDEFNFEFDATNRITKKKSNIGYSLDTEEYYSLNKMDSAIKAIALNDTLVNPDELNDLFAKVGNAADTNRYKKIFHDQTTVTDWIAFNNSGTVLPRRVDSFKNLINNLDDPDKIDIELKIIPASFKTIKLQTDVALLGGSKKYYYMQFPVVGTYDPFIFQRGTDGQSDYSIQNLLAGEDSINATTAISDKMRLAIYSGRHYVDIVGADWLDKVEAFEQFPISYVEDLPEYFNELARERRFTNWKYPFRLQWLNDNIYSKTANLNESKLFKFTFHEKESIDITSIFLINNKNYLCSKIERLATIDGLKNPSLGYFYSFE